MRADIAEPVRDLGQDHKDPLLVLIRIEWAPGTVWNVVASGDAGRWWVSGIERPCKWGEVLTALKVEPRHRDSAPYTVEVRRLY